MSFEPCLVWLPILVLLHKQPKHAQEHAGLHHIFHCALACIQPQQLVRSMVTTQRVVLHHEPGDASVLKTEEQPIPKRQTGEVLVKQHSTSVNPVDYKMRKMNKDNLPKVRMFALPYTNLTTIPTVGHVCMHWPRLAYAIPTGVADPWRRHCRCRDRGRL